MNTLRESLQDYLALRRSLGFKLRSAGICLAKFATFLEERGAAHITTQLALQWVQQSASAQPATRAQRLGYVRGFARYRAASDPQTEIVPPSLLPFRPRRTRPYLYSEAEIARLLKCALALPAAGGLRPLTYYCLLGLLSVTGMRIGEALRLQLEDVDLQQGLLTIRGTKFGKSRLVPIHPSTQAVLARYRARRQRCVAGAVASSFFFVTGRGHHLDIGDVQARRVQARGRGCMIFVIDLPRRRCCAGIARASRPNAACRCCRPIWGMFMLPTPTGISVRVRN
jgi:integrase/recombinase XerD